MIEVPLLNNPDSCLVLVDDATPDFGGSFYGTPLRPYSPLPIRWAYEQLIRYPKATLIDVGANTGCYTLLAKHHPDMTVHAFEPVHRTFEVLQRNVHLNDLESKVTLNQLAVSNYKGVGTLHSIRATGGSGVSMVDGIPAYHKDVLDSPVAVLTLDQYCKANKVCPTLLKIDTEGGDKFVLEGAHQTIKKYHPFIIIEISAENTNQYGYPPSEIIALLEKLDYVWSSPEGTDAWCVYKDWESIGKFLNIEGED